MNKNLAIYNFTDNAYKYDGNSRPNEKINKNTIFECASLSKQVFAYIALKKLSLDKTIYDYLTKNELNCFGINSHFDKRYEKITIRMLLSHTSGLPNNSRDNLLEFNPGTKFKYSGNGFFILQRIIEKITGKTLNEIYNDFGFKNSSFIYEKKFKNKLAGRYDGKKYEGVSINFELPISYGSLYSNLEDYVKFLFMLKEDKKVLNLMMEKQIKITKNISVGLGVFLFNGYIWQYGDNWFFKNFLYFNPNDNAGFISLSNNTKGWNFVDIPNEIKKFLIDEYKNKGLFIHQKGGTLIEINNSNSIIQIIKTPEEFVEIKEKLIELTKICEPLDDPPDMKEGDIFFVLKFKETDEFIGYVKTTDLEQFKRYNNFENKGGLHDKKGIQLSGVCNGCPSKFRNVATPLINFIETYAKRNGYQYILLHAGIDRDYLISEGERKGLYIKLGYKKIGILPQSSGFANIDLWIMRKNI